MMNLGANYELSIIIPAYNSIKTISTTLESIKIQNLPILFEVLIVNDWSDYDYSEIISKYKNYFNIREIKTKENIGPGAARQVGIDNSLSKYIVFIDSDDLFYNQESVFSMYNKILKEDADILISNFIYRRDEKELIKKKNLIWLHGKMYKREFLNNNSIRFNNSRANEDNGFNRLILLLNPKYAFLDKVVYIYNENPDSITRKDKRAYRFTGLEGFCYNMNWAMDEALSRGTSENKIALLSLDILAALYIYYLGLEKEYDVSKILEWGKEIKQKYDKYKSLLEKDIHLIVLNEKIEFLKYDFIIDDFYITFEEFLDKINKNK